MQEYKPWENPEFLKKCRNCNKVCDTSVPSMFNGLWEFFCSTDCIADFDSRQVSGDLLRAVRAWISERLAKKPSLELR